MFALLKTIQRLLIPYTSCDADKKKILQTFDKNETETEKSSINVIRMQAERIICANEIADNHIVDKEITAANVDDMNVQRERPCNLQLANFDQTNIQTNKIHIANKV